MCCPVLSSSRFIVVYFKPVHPDLGLSRGPLAEPSLWSLLLTTTSVSRLLGTCPQPIALLLLSWENPAPPDPVLKPLSTPQLSPQQLLLALCSLSPSSYNLLPPFGRLHLNTYTHQHDLSFPPLCPAHPPNLHSPTRMLSFVLMTQPWKMYRVFNIASNPTPIIS